MGSNSTTQDAVLDPLCLGVSPGIVLCHDCPIRCHVRARTRYARLLRRSCVRAMVCGLHGALGFLSLGHASYPAVAIVVRLVP